MVSKRKTLFVFLIWLGCFSCGLFIWRVYHSGTLFRFEEKSVTSPEDIEFSVYIGDYLITREEVDWEYRMYLSQVNQNEDATTYRDLSNGSSDFSGKIETVDSSKPIVELYNKIIGDLIERKLLYQFVLSDSAFSLNEPSRYTHCIAAWQSSVRSKGDFFSTDKSRERLKSMLCEKDILDQYLSEQLLGRIVFSDDDLRAYFHSHKEDFTLPARILIRQVLLASENEAKRVRGSIDASNFASIAQERSIAPESDRGGLLGPFAKGEMPSIFDVAFEMNFHEIQGILKSPYGFHIIMLEKKFPREVLSFDESKDRVRSLLFTKSREKEYSKWIEMALNRIPIRSSKDLF